MQLIVNFFYIGLSLLLIGCKSLDFVQYGIEGKDVNQIAIFGSEKVNFSDLDKVELKGFQISDFNYPKVKEYLKAYQNGAKKNLIAILKRGQKYIPTIKRIFKAKGVPEEFCYLPIIESGFKAQATSYKHAVGLWQFIYTTGKYYELDNSYWHDDRLDPLKATVAAAYHLKYLYKQFNDWLLVLAAYNAGSGKISRAIKMYNTRNFWEMCQGKYLKKETKNYVPKFIATTLIAKNPKAYNIPLFDGLEGNKLTTYSVSDATEVRLLAKCAKMDIQSFKDLNPALKRWATPPATAFDINLPEDKLAVFIENFSQIDDSKRVTYRQYLVRIGDNLTSISEKFSVPIRPIAALNKLKSLNQVRAGNNIFIPIQGLKKARSTDDRFKQTKHQVSKKYTYTFFHEVDKTDTLYLIAKKYSVDLVDIYRWNNLISFHSIRPGMLLMIKE